MIDSAPPKAEHSEATKASQEGRRAGRVKLRDAAAAFYQAGWHDEFNAIVDLMAEHGLAYKTEKTVRAYAEAYTLYCGLGMDEFKKWGECWPELFKYESGAVGDEIEPGDLPYTAFMRCSWYEMCPRPIVRFDADCLVAQCASCHQLLHKQLLGDSEVSRKPEEGGPDGR